MVIKIMLVDDHPVFRSGLKNILEAEDEFEIVAEADNGEAAVAEAVKMKPDLIIMDINMPGKDGIEATRTIKESVPDTKILIMTMYSDEAYLKEGLKAGAAGYVLKRAVDTELITAIRTIAKGEHYIYPTLVPRLYIEPLASNAAKTDNQQDDLLSVREKEVLKYIALGFTQKEISKELYISIKTVDTYKTRIMEKIGAKKKSHIVKFALENGILTNKD